jgi:hypothetical protein
VKTANAAPPDLIAHGRTADVYAWTSGSVLKLFHPWFDREGPAHEARVARAIHGAGLPVPWVGDLVEVEGRAGLVYERVDGRPMWTELIAHPWRLSALARLLADLHAQIHGARCITAVPPQRERLRTRIAEAPSLSDRLRQAALAALAALPDGDRLCHGDFRHT